MNVSVLLLLFFHCHAHTTVMKLNWLPCLTALHSSSLVGGCSQDWKADCWCDAEMVNKSFPVSKKKVAKKLWSCRVVVLRMNMCKDLREGAFKQMENGQLSDWKKCIIHTIHLSQAWFLVLERLRNVGNTTASEKGHPGPAD